MSLPKLIKSSLHFFKKQIITFLVIRRHDLGMAAESLRYISVRPMSSISMLRYKVWHLLDLPDFCDERIILKNHKEVEIPLTELLRGNSPQSPYILEVWPPEKQYSFAMVTNTATTSNMLLGAPDADTSNNTEQAPEKGERECTRSLGYKRDLKDFSLQRNYFESKTTINNILHSDGLDYRPSDLSFRKTTSTAMFKLHGRKSKDNLTNVLIKIQNDLANLSTKMNYLETRLPDQ
ncbi:uncharacterized protein LOC105386961 [Plutella xylostella]|uniref:uncharacterized protein LOC105386961 n=1 Tax=Plutella xylostella TaxID=51655 RepID=UPI0020325A7D|nr:uncharacterized protein LOC105386961 [Plutella xylostella]